MTSGGIVRIGGSFRSVIGGWLVFFPLAFAKIYIYIFANGT